jgi:SNF2 family DNA or RNA helicase
MAQRVEYLVKPWAHQLKAIEAATKNGVHHYALFFDLGAGKTATTINILRHQFKKSSQVLKTLILCPPVVIENWSREWLVHSKIKPKDVVMLKGSAIKRVQKLEEEWSFRENFVVITNYEALLMTELHDRLVRWAPQVIVADESHKIKDISAKRTKKAIELADIAAYRYILSGTPVLNSPLDLFSQFRFLDGGELFTRNFFVFRAKYFFNRADFMPAHIKSYPDWRIRTGALEEISKMIAPYSMSVKKKDCMDLPPMVRQTYRVEMLPAQQKAYNEMRKNLITFFKENACTAQIALTKTLRLMQICSGFIKDEQGNEHTFVESDKIKGLRDLLQSICSSDSTNKVIIWAVFKNNFKQIAQVCNGLEIEYVELHGDVNENLRQANIDAFNNNKQIKVLIGHPGSGGIGVNLTAANYCIFYSRDFSLEHDLQAEARNYRGGSEIHEKVTRIDLVCKDTIDELVVKRLADKEDVGETILKDLMS